MIEFLRRKENSGLLILLGCLGTVIGLGILALRIDKARREMIGPFLPKLKEYQSIWEAAREQKSEGVCVERPPLAGPKRPCLSGRVILIRDDGIDAMDWVCLPEEFRARNPEEVKAIIHVSQGSSSRVGRYTDGTGAYQGASMVLDVIDVKSKTIITTIYREGGSPPERKMGTMPQHGSNAGLPTPKEFGEMLEKVRCK